MAEDSAGNLFGKIDVLMPIREILGFKKLYTAFANLPFNMGHLQPGMKLRQQQVVFTTSGTHAKLAALS